ncbi:hypothetical protein C8F01DRAFT_1372324 [Mycena amicta]|nr:hypothetical protein C8F01DRAFT_1372324 [Mycena amicta]
MSYPKYSRGQQQQRVDPRRTVDPTTLNSHPNADGRPSGPRQRTPSAMPPSSRSRSESTAQHLESSTRSKPRSRVESTHSPRYAQHMKHPVQSAYPPPSSFRGGAISHAPLFANSASQPFMAGDDESSVAGSFEDESISSLTSAERAEAFGYFNFEPLPAGFTPSGQFAAIYPAASTDKTLKRRSRSVGSFRVHTGPISSSPAVQVHRHAIPQAQSGKVEPSPLYGMRHAARSTAALQSVNLRPPVPAKPTGSRRYLDVSAPTPPLKDKKWRKGDTASPPAPVQSVEYPVFKRKGMAYLVNMFA